MAPAPVDIPAFARTQLALLDAELQSEVAETAALVAAHTPAALQRAGLALANLAVASRRTGPGGRAVLGLAPNVATGGGAAGLPEHGLRAGDIVLVTEQPAGNAKRREVKDLERKGARGVVARVRRADVEVAVDEEVEEGVGAGRLWLVKLADEVTYKR